MERVLKNADISVLSNFLATKILPSTIYMPNFRSIGPFKQKLQRGGGAYQSAKSLARLGLMFKKQTLGGGSGQETLLTLQSS